MQNWEGNLSLIENSLYCFINNNPIHNAIPISLLLTILYSKMKFYSSMDEGHAQFRTIYQQCSKCKNSCDCNIHACTCMTSISMIVWSMSVISCQSFYTPVFLISFIIIYSYNLILEFSKIPLNPRWRTIRILIIGDDFM